MAASSHAYAGRRNRQARDRDLAPSTFEVIMRKNGSKMKITPALGARGGIKHLVDHQARCGDYIIGDTEYNNQHDIGGTSTNAMKDASPRATTNSSTRRRRRPGRSPARRGGRPGRTRPCGGTRASSGTARTRASRMSQWRLHDIGAMKDVQKSRMEQQRTAALAGPGPRIRSVYACPFKMWVCTSIQACLHRTR